MMERPKESMTLAAVLQGLGLEKYVPLLVEQEELDLESFLLLKEEDLLRLSVPTGPRKKLLQKVQQLKEEETTTSSSTSATSSVVPAPSSVSPTSEITKKEKKEKKAIEATPIWRSAKHAKLYKLIERLDKADVAKAQKHHKEEVIQVVLVGEARQNHLLLRLYDPLANFDDYVPTNIDHPSIRYALPSLPQLAFNITYVATSSSKEYNNLRGRIIYPGTGVVLLCFSLHNRSSLESASEFFFAELKQFIPDTPIILVGAELQKRATHPDAITTEEGIAMARQLQVEAYIECSGKYDLNIRKLQEEVVVAHLARNKHVASLLAKLRAKTKLFFNK
ncbi:ras small GTPase RAC1 [Balamuthia mandrillaris]